MVVCSDVDFSKESASAAKRRLIILKMLIDAGADVNSQYEDYGNALSTASARENGDVVKLLIDAGANVNARCFGQFPNPLTAASRMLINAGADVDPPCCSRATYCCPINVASACGNEKIFEILIDAGVDVNEGLLFNAIYSQSVSILKLLMREGQQTYFIDPMGRSLLHRAVSLPHWTSMSHEQELCSRCQIVRLLLDEGSQVDMKDNEGNSTLAAAVDGG